MKSQRRTQEQREHDVDENETLPGVLEHEIDAAAGDLFVEWLPQLEPLVKVLGYE